MGVGSDRPDPWSGYDRITVIMTLSESINTLNYRKRIIALLVNQKGKLTPEQYSQFASSFERELKRLNAEASRYELERSSTLVSTVNSNSFRRLIPPQPRVGANVWLCGSLYGAGSADQNPFVKSERFLWQDVWNRIDPTFDCKAA